MKSSRLPPLLALTLLLQACAPTPAPKLSNLPPAPLSTTSQAKSSGIDLPALCAELQVVDLSRLDTTGTKEQVAQNNLVIQLECHR